MTTPPDTPKPPREITRVFDKLGRLVGLDDAKASEADFRYPQYAPHIEYRYILAPSPQESHKLAEELERRCQELAQAHPPHVNGPIHNIAALVMTHRDAILAALRSSTSEQEARDAGRYRLIRRVSLPEWERLGHYTEEALDEQIDAAIAASGGAKGDGNG